MGPVRFCKCINDRKFPWGVHSISRNLIENLCLKCFIIVGIMASPKLKFCCNSHSKKNHLRIFKQVFAISDHVREKFCAELGDKGFICSSCYTGLQKKKKSISTISSEEIIEGNTIVNRNDKVFEQPEPLNEEECDDLDLESEANSSDSGHNEECVHAHEEMFVDSLNGTLRLLEQPPIPSDWHRRSVAEKRKKIEAINTSIAKQLMSGDFTTDIEDIVEEIKERLKDAKTPEEKYQILSMLPKSWEPAKIQHIFNVSYYTAQRAYSHHQQEGMGAPVQKRFVYVHIEE